MTTKLIEDEYRGSKFLKIVNVDEEGKPVNEGKKPVHAFGLVKAEAMLDHLDEVKEWVAKNTKRESNATPSS